MEVDAREGDDLVRIDGGEGNDTITYDVSPGQDTVFINGGPGLDKLTINQLNNNFTLVEESGHILFSVGSGGTYLIVKELERITVLGAGGQVLYSWNTIGIIHLPLILN